MPDPDPIRAESARPSIRGNRLIAPGSEHTARQLDVVVTSPVAPGDTATATARAEAGSHCTIAVTYRSGRSEAQGLGPEVAGEDGAVSWSWIVGINTTPGDWSVDVECAGGDGSRGAGRATLEVRP